MIIQNDKGENIIFIHIPRTGGSYVAAYFKNHKCFLNDYQKVTVNNFEEGHEKIKYYYNNGYKDCKSFTIIRDPLHRFASALKRVLTYLNLPIDYFKDMKNYDDFKTFIYNQRGTILEQFLEHQYKFIDNKTKIYKFDDGLSFKFLDWLKDNFNLTTKIKYPKYLKMSSDFLKPTISKETIKFVEMYYKEDYKIL